MRLLRLLSTLAFIAFVLPMSGQLNGQPSLLTKLYIHTGPDPFDRYSHLRYAGRDWKTMTTLLQGKFDITAGAALPSFPNLDLFDALWIDQRYGAKPTAAELNTMLAFASTGRRIVIVGENSYPGDLHFFNWSAPFVAALGGTQAQGNATLKPGTYYSNAAGCVYGNVNTIFAHALTSAVNQAHVGCAGYALGGTALFDYNVATLWGQPQNVLTILDTNILDDYFGSVADSPKFRTNVVQWLDQSAITAVPEPSTYAMLVPALLVIAGVMRRRRRIVDG